MNPYAQVAILIATSSAVATIVVALLNRRLTSAQTGKTDAESADILAQASERVLNMMRSQLEAAQQRINELETHLRQAMQRIAHLEGVLERRSMDRPVESDRREET